MHGTSIERYRHYLPLLRTQTDECVAKLNTTIDEWELFIFYANLGVIFFIGWNLKVKLYNRKLTENKRLKQT